MKRLLIRPGGIGDFLLALPAMERLRAGYTEVWTASRNVPLARFADRADSIASTGLDLLGLPATEPPRELLRRLGRFDSIVSWYGSNRLEFTEAVRGLGLPFQFLRALPEEGAKLHAADYYLQQAGGFSDGGGAVPRIECPRADGGYAVIHPFSGSLRKNWPLERFREVASFLASRMPVRWCAGPEEDLEGAVRFDNLYELGCWLAKACLYIGNDSGITHLAAAVGTPVVALFGPTDPAVWAPRGSSVKVVSVQGPMERLSLETVLSALKMGSA